MFVTHLLSAATNITAKHGKGLPRTTASKGIADTSGKWNAEWAAVLGRRSLCEVRADVQTDQLSRKPIREAITLLDSAHYLRVCSVANP